MKTKRFLIILAMFMIAGLSANAQSRYSGEVDFGYSLSFEKFGIEMSDRINVSTTHGVMFNERFFLGAGAGLDYAYETDVEVFMIPVYANVKGFLPISEKSSVFASADIGYTIGIENDYGNSVSCFYCCPSIGLKMNKFKIQVGYSMLVDLVTIGAMQFKVGFTF